MPSLDPATQESLIRGDVHPDDAPPGYQEVARLLRAVRETPPVAPLPNEHEIVAAMAARVTSGAVHPRRQGMRSDSKRTFARAKLVAVLVAGSLVAMTGLAFAGVLPGPAQRIASNVLSKIGITVPGPDDHAGTPLGGPSPSVAVPTPTLHGKGAGISNLARTTPAKGVNKGAVISTAASNGKSQAGQHGQATSHPSPAPPAGGSGGSTTGATHSGGHSSEGSGNSAGH